MKDTLPEDSLAHLAYLMQFRKVADLFKHQQCILNEIVDVPSIDVVVHHGTF